VLNHYIRVEFWYVQPNVISDGFLKLESLVFLMTPSPKHSLRKTAEQMKPIEIR